MKKSIITGVIGTALLTSVAWADSPPLSDADFVMKATVGNTFEIEESKLAESKATDPRLKKFAQQMIADHSDALKKLEADASKMGHKTGMMLDPPHQAKVDGLKALSGADFDKRYMADQVAAHAETADLLTGYEQNGKNSALLTWTKATLPVVKHHKAEIDAM